MQITIIGVGLIGGSFARALKQRGLAGRIVGCDRPEVLERALGMAAIDEAVAEPEAAIKNSQLILLATPVGAILDLIERLGPLLPPGALLTDVGSTKAEIVAKARAVFGDAAGKRFLPGHPMAGKEHGGIEHADADLFTGAGWMLTPICSAGVSPTERGAGVSPAGPVGVPPASAPVQMFLDLLHRLDIRPLFMDAALHDRLCAWISHLPQMVSTALAAALVEEFRDDPALLALGGRALRDMTRLAQSPYSVWRDIALTNAGNIQDALLRLEQRLAHIRETLRTRELEAEFSRARELPK
jgi:prephenate dehydrogenase